jgi:hypothetical protein
MLAPGARAATSQVAPTSVCFVLSVVAFEWEG